MLEAEILKEAKNFFNSNKESLGEAIRKKSKIVELDFMKLIEFSSKLTYEMMINPQETINLIRLSIEELGLVKDSKIHLINLPESYKIPLYNIRLPHLGTIIEIEGVIVKRGKITPKVRGLKIECPTCGTIMTILPEKNSKETHRCTCGRRGGFRIINRNIIETLNVFVQDKNGGEGREITFTGDFLGEKYNNFLEEGNLISVIVIVGEKTLGKDELDIDYDLIPVGLKLLKDDSNKGEGISSFLDILKKRKQGAYEFEELVGLLFKKKGYNVKVTKRSGDYGTDVIAEKGSERIAIQCKLNDSNVQVTNSVIQKALGSLASPYNANKLIVITTSDKFTPNAIEQIKNSKVPIELWNRDKFIVEYNAYVRDLEEAWDILNKEEIPTINPPFENSTSDIYKISGKSALLQRNRIFMVKEVITALESKMGKMIPCGEIEKELQGKMEKEELDEIISMLISDNEIYRPKKEYIGVF